MGKRYGPTSPIGERPLRSKMLGHKGPLRFSLRLGEIQRIDYENFLCDIHWIQGSSPPAREVPISGAYWSRRGFLGAMPEEGSIVICGFSAVHEDAAVRPFILGFIPNGYITALNFDPFGVAERGAPEIDTPFDELQRELDGVYGPTRHKMRKLYPGDVYGASDKGAELILDTDVRLFDHRGGEFWLRGDDQSLTTTTMDLYQATAASRRRSGRITRSGLLMPADMVFGEGGIPLESAIFELLVDAGLVYEDGTLPPDINTLPFVTLASGERLGLITENLQDPTDPEVRVFTEDRVEIQEFSDQTLPYPDTYGFDADQISEESHWRPFITKVSGTVVGNDPYTAKGRSQYGKLLKPVIFNEPSSTEGSPRLEVVPNEAGEPEKNLVAAGLYSMQRPDGLGELFIAHDKEGHCFLSIPASSSRKSNLGAGRSVEAELRGSIKTVIGADKNNSASWDLSAKGGFKWSLGTLAASRRSLDLSTKGSVFLQVRGTDLDGYGLKAEIVGDVGWGVEGNVGISASDQSIERAGSLMQKSAESMELNVGTGDLNMNVVSNISRTVSGSETNSIGQGRKTTITKPLQTGANAEQLRILAGNRNTTFVLPATDTIEFLGAGTRTIRGNAALSASWQTSLAGTYSFTAASGSFNVAMGTGAISLTSSAVTITAAASVSITGSSIGLTGSVGLGTGTAAPLAVIGGVPGPSPYIDPITGLPLTGNPLVRTV